jgi:hypothetical protein
MIKLKIKKKNNIKIILLKQITEIEEIHKEKLTSNLYKLGFFFLNVSLFLTS